jgi:hypothetical protein
MASTRVAPARDNSSLTAFQKNRGDSSKSFLFIAVGASLAMLIAIFVFGKEPPAGLSEEPERKALPKDLVQMALKAPVDVPELPADQTPQPDLVAPKQKPGEEAASGPPEAAVADKPVSREGTLDLTTTPQVDVYDGNTMLGRTPFSTKLPTGVHKLRFTDAKTGLNIYKQYRIQPGAEVRDSIEFGTSELSVTAPDGALIELSGRPLGKAPLDVVKIYEGKYLLKVTYEGKKWTEWFDAPAGRKIEFKVQLKAD